MTKRPEHRHTDQTSYFRYTKERHSIRLAGCNVLVNFDPASIDPALCACSFYEWKEAGFVFTKMFKSSDKAFHIFVGRKSFSLNNFPPYDTMLTEAAYNKVKLLNSPHAYSLMKAFIAKTGYQRPLPPKEM